MKKYKILLFAGAVTAIIGSSCKKDYHKAAAEYSTDISSSSFLKVIDATVGSARTYVYQDALTTPLTGSPLAIGSSAGSFPFNGNYTNLPSGSRTIIVKDTLSTSVQKVINYSGNFNSGSYYTMFMYDTSANAKYILVQDTIQTPTDTTARVRFANLVYSSSAVPNVDVYSTRMGANLFTNVSIGQVTQFVPLQTKNTDTVYVRATGTTTNLAQLNSFTPVIGRSYSLVFEGRYQTTSGTLSAGTPTRSLLLYTNR